MTRNSLVLADAGAIVGLIRPRDQWHEWTINAANQLSPPLYTCETVIAEACFLVRDLWPAQQRILGMLSDGFLKIEFSFAPEIERIYRTDGKIFGLTHVSRGRLPGQDE